MGLSVDVVPRLYNLSEGAPVKLLWILCFLAMGTLQQAYADVRILDSDTLQCGSVVVGASLSAEKGFRLGRLSQGRIDSISKIFLGKNGTENAFTVKDWRITGQQQIEDSLLISLEFVPREVVSYVGFASVVLETPTGTDTVMVPIAGQGIKLRFVPSFSIDFGDVKVNTAPGMWVEPLAIYNDGVTSVTIKVELNGAGGVFSFEPNMKEVTIASGQACFLEMNCFSAGQASQEIVRTVTDTLRISVGSDALQQKELFPLKVRFITPRANTEFMNFGNVLMNTTKVKTFSYTNTSGGLLLIMPMEITGGDGAFQLIKPMGAIDLFPNQTLQIEVAFTPSREREVSGQFIIATPSSNQGTVELQTVELTAHGFSFASPVVTTGSMRVNVGEKFFFPVTINFDTVNVRFMNNSNAESLHYELALSLNASIANIAAANVDSVVLSYGDQIVYISGDIDTDTLTNELRLDLEMQALLGDTDSSSVVGFREMELTAPGTNFVRAGDILPGFLVLDDVFIWPNGQKRLVNTRKGNLQLEVAPNPAKSNITIAAGGFSGTAVLSIYTALGNELFHQELDKPGIVNTSVSELGVGRGIYYCRLSSSRNSLVKLLRVE